MANVGGLLQRAGFTPLTIDVDTFQVSFPNAAILMEHLQRMGENSAGIQRKPTRTGRDTFLAAIIFMYSPRRYGHPVCTLGR